MSAKHTPGPWTQGTSAVGITCVWLDGLTEQKHKMGQSHTWIDCETEANARLISAAPELLEALLSCLEKGSRWHPCDPVVIKARAAITKAIG